MNIGIFGITANPPHFGHIKAIEFALNFVDEVWVTPVFNHPFGKSFIQYEQRLDMLSILIKESNIKNVYIKELDKDYYSNYNEVVYSYNLLKYLKSNYSHEFKLIIGEDNYKPEVWSKFYNYEKLEEEFGVIVIKEQGFHSTDVRNMIKENMRINEKVGNNVEKYIEMNNLYKEELKCKI